MSTSRDILPDILAPGLDVVFVGAAPSPAAALTGHYYAGPRNRFWDLLHRAGFTPYRLDASEDSRVLEFGIGLTAVFKHLVSSANSLLPQPEEERLTELYNKLVAYAPRIVCYNGKDVCQMCTGLREVPWGLLPSEGPMVEFVVPSSSGRADGMAMERLFLYRQLRQLVLQLRDTCAQGTGGDSLRRIA